MGMWIGSSKNNVNTAGNIKWIKLGGHLKILGIYFDASNEASKIECNWSERIDKIKVLIRVRHEYQN